MLYFLSIYPSFQTHKTDILTRIINDPAKLQKFCIEIPFMIQPRKKIKLRISVELGFGTRNEANAAGASW